MPTDSHYAAQPTVPRDDCHREWQMRWLYKRSSRRAIMHRVVSGTYTEELLPVGVDNGKSLCGLTGAFGMPGIFGRMGSPRCATCCKIVGIPAGNGAPFNVFRGKKQHA